MSRIRTIKPDFFKHEGLFDGEQDSGLPLRLAFAGLWTQCDREGRFAWRPRQLKVDIFPYDEIDFSRVLDALATRGFIVKYTCENREFGFIPSWHRHQVINNREKKSDLPNPSENIIVSDASATREARVDHAGKEEGKGKEGKGSILSETSSDQKQKIKKRISYPEAFEAFWKDYPRTDNMSKFEAFTEWNKLDDDDKAACAASVPRFKAFLKTKPDLEVIHACRFISKRRFEGFTVTAAGSSELADETWSKRLRLGRRTGQWSTAEWGPRPGLPGCFVPAGLIEAGDGDEWRELEMAA